ncbi:hypothetical protein J6590_056081 [Homalodisca vitripennis]|nr:hypothetical protein J6590_056081 [Homalodisca vitripennis]
MDLRPLIKNRTQLDMTLSCKLPIRSAKERSIAIRCPRATSDDAKLGLRSPPTLNGFKGDFQTNSRAGGQDRTGSFSDHPSKQQPRSIRLSCDNHCIRYTAPSIVIHLGWRGAYSLKRTNRQTTKRGVATIVHGHTINTNNRNDNKKA